MRILLVGATGTIGVAVLSALQTRGHSVATASRSSGDVTIDLSDPETIERAYSKVGPLDAVICAAGNTVFKPFADLSREDVRTSVADKALGQVELVRLGLEVVEPSGVFVLTSGILSRVSVTSGAAAAAANGAVESFVQAVAPEIAPRRINAISPTVLSESAEKYDAVFPGFEPVPAAQVARAFVRAVEGQETGHVHRLG